MRESNFYPISHMCTLSLWALETQLDFLGVGEFSGLEQWGGKEGPAREDQISC